jgi:NADPH-dependent glutamate synthase beta subunit-like oxidoreductase/CO/xanthine dehydrogenase FAD-binding subunit
MALRSFEHTTASSVEQASELTEAAPGRTVVVAGGTDLLGGLKDNIYPTYPELLIDLKRVASLRHLDEDEHGLRIGALTTLREIATNPAVTARYRALAGAARAVASPQIRNVATIGGNICQEPRCWYYRHPENRFNCLRKGGEHCNAVFGENRYHSVFGAARVVAAPCSQGCPAGTAVPAYMARLREGDLPAAASILIQCNPMPAITGRVCPHTCEQGCNRSDLDHPVSVRTVERFLGDWVLDHADELYPSPADETGKRVAVVGAGPAGLAAACSLRRAGHGVTVMDSMPEAGGMLRWSIPAYRLPSAVVARQVAAFTRMGIAFEMGTTVGRGGTSLRALRRKYDGVVLATGAWREKRLGIAREELLDSGLAFLRGIRQGTVSTVAPRVVVIGGGNVAVDVAVSALRLGAREVTMACLESLAEMPAFPEDLEQALLERVKVLPSWGPLHVLERDGVLTGLELVSCTSVFDAAGRFAPTFDPTVTTTIEAGQVLLAIGQAADVSYVGKSPRTARGLIVIDQETGATSAAGVYACGDATSGPATVVEAIAGGLRAARALDAFLAETRPAATAEAAPPLHQVNVAALAPADRATAPELDVVHRTIDGEDRATIDAAAVASEARRCADCGCVAVNASDLAPALIALDATIRTNRRSIPAQDFFAARTLGSTVLEAGELVEEVVVPAPADGTRQSFVKFRTRASIDFPIVSVAAVLTMRGDDVARARIALGALAPVPLRAAEAESLIEGRPPDGAAAAEAGAAAVRGAVTLSKNRFKVPIVKALVARAITEAR